MKKDNFQPGEPCWVDCGTDLSTAPAFYEALFGWKIESLGEESGGYCMATKDGANVAGFGPQQAPGTPYWSVYFRTDDVAKTVELVKTNGGAVYADAMEVMEAGHMAVLADPAGAAFSVWQPKSHAGFGEVDAPGTFCWAELTTTDVDGAKRFYGDVLGLTAKDSTDPEMAYTELLVNDRSIAGMMPKPDEMPAEVPPFWGVYFAVEDTDATIERVEQLGGTKIFGPMDVPPGRFATFVDPAGAPFSVIALAQS
jgi:hypothetical protein